MKPLLRVFGALFVGLWRVLDGLRRALLNLLLLLARMTHNAGGNRRA
jgi:hypothetical protein